MVKCIGGYIHCHLLLHVAASLQAAGMWAIDVQCEVAAMLHKRA